MRVAIFTDTMDRAGMGTALYTRQLVTHLLKIRNEHNLELFLVHRKKNDDPLYREGIEVILPKVTIPKLTRILPEAMFLWKTRNDFDIIHYPQESIFPLFWLSNAKVIVTVHSHIQGWRDYGAKIRYWMVVGTLRFFAWRIAAILCNSASVAKDITNHFAVSPGKVHHIPAGVDESFRTSLTHEEAKRRITERYGLPTPFVLVPSRMDPQKNIPRIIQAYALLKREHQIPQALVVGAKHSGAVSKQAGDLIKHYGLEKSVVFMPYIENEDMPALYAAADATLYPSLHEGFGLPILESMAAGTPVITSSVFSMPEVAGGAGVLVEPNNVEKIAEALWKVLRDEKVRGELIGKGKRNALKYSWEKTAHAVLALYETIGVRRS